MPWRVDWYKAQTVLWIIEAQLLLAQLLMAQHTGAASVALHSAAQPLKCCFWVLKSYLTHFLSSTGLFLAPQMVGEALKGGRLIAQVMSQAGYPCTPMQGLPTPHSFITAVHLGSPAKMTAFCRAVQRCCPIGSYIQPIPGTVLSL